MRCKFTIIYLKSKIFIQKGVNTFSVLIFLKNYEYNFIHLIDYITNYYYMNRVLAVDIFRGLTIALMFVVNNPGTWSHIYVPLEHAEWNGCTPTDWVFPFFLFTVGISCFFSIQKVENKTTTFRILKIWKRAAIIFLIGLGLNAFPLVDTIYPLVTKDFSTLRIMGVLQRIALAYAFGATICLLVSYRKIILFIAALILLFYWWILWRFGDYSADNSFAAQIDRILLGKHIWKGGNYDPEGLIATIPAVATVLIAYCIGSIIDGFEKIIAIRKLIPFGLVLLGLGFLWNFWFPINKALWTSSYVLYTAGLATIIIAVLMYIIDVKNYTKMVEPIQVLGMNSILAFVISGVYVKLITKIKFLQPDTSFKNIYNYIYDYGFASWFGDNAFASMLFAFFHLLLFWTILRWFYNRKIFLKV
jgi:predicted acyltransferase